MVLCSSFYYIFHNNEAIYFIDITPNSYFILFFFDVTIFSFTACYLVVKRKSILQMRLMKMATPQRLGDFLRSSPTFCGVALFFFYYIFQSHVAPYFIDLTPSSLLTFSSVLFDTPIVFACIITFDTGTSFPSLNILFSKSFATLYLSPFKDPAKVHQQKYRTLQSN